MPGIAYDESGSLAGYFGVTFLAVVLVPVTWIVFRPAQKESLTPLCHCDSCKANFSRIAVRKASTHRKRFLRRIAPLLLAWAFFGYLCYVVASAPRDALTAVYNPFEILGLSSSSTEKQIKKHYRKLSLLYHPDKVVLAENQTKEEADSKFIDLTKAYKALTDEVTRENLAKYGNPDGPQQREDRIAIPKWVVEGKNSFWVLGAYGLLLGGGIPYVVGKWWFSQRRHTRDGVLNPTAEHFFYHLKEDTDFSTLINILAGAAEFAGLLGGPKKGSKKERKERQGKVEDLEKDLEKRKAELGVEDSPVMRKESQVATTSAVSRRAKTLLWAHLLRVDIDDAELRSELEPLLRELQPLLTAFSNIALARAWLNVSIQVLKLQAALVQALPPTCSPLAQLPSISPEKGFELQVANGAEGRRWMEKFVKKCPDISKEDRKVAEEWLRLELVSAEFKVPGERVVSPSSIVNLNVRLRYVYPTTSSSTPPKALPNGDHVKSEPNGDAKPDLTEKIESAAADVNAKDEKADVKERVEDLKNDILKLAKESQAIGSKGKAVKEADKVYPPNGYAHAPHWPMVRKPHFHVMLGDSKLDKVIVPPIRVTDIPLPRADGLASDPREFTLTFPAPPNPNTYSFVLHCVSDTFLGADLSLPIIMKVEEPPEHSDSDDDDDISEPEEDSLAGQMAMMRGGKVKPSPVHGDDDSEEESEYETSSDEEGPRGRANKAINEDTESDSD